MSASYDDMADLASWIESAAIAAAGRDRQFASSPFAAEAARIESTQGGSARAAFLRDVLGALLRRGRPQIATRKVPAAVKVLYEIEFVRIEADVAAAADSHFNLADHSMRCDFRIAGFGRIPVGVHHVEIGGVPRRLLWSGGAGQAWQFVRLMAKTGGWKPFYVSHFSHGISRRDFRNVYTRDAQATWHRNVADCLRLNPDVRGLVATSWWYDPQLAQVAPHLAFLREGSMQHGAVQLRAGVTHGATKYALANSPVRQRLYDSGAYVPVSHAMIWTREALIAWAG